MISRFAAPATVFRSVFKKGQQILPVGWVSVSGYGDAIKGFATYVAFNNQHEFLHVQFFLGRGPVFLASLASSAACLREKATSVTQ